MMMRTEADGTNGGILRSHVDVRSVADVSRHTRREDPIGGGPLSLYQFWLFVVSDGRDDTARLKQNKYFKQKQVNSRPRWQIEDSELRKEEEEKGQYAGAAYILDD
jgi:hypothetical protein